MPKGSIKNFIEGEPWTKEQDEFLIARWNEGAPYTTLVQEFKLLGERKVVTKDSLSSRINKLRQRGVPLQERGARGKLIKDVPPEKQLLLPNVPRLPIDPGHPPKKTHKGQRWEPEVVQNLLKLWDDPSVSASRVLRVATAYRRGVTLKQLSDTMRRNGATLDRKTMRRRRGAYREPHHLVKAKPLPFELAPLPHERQGETLFWATIQAAETTVFSRSITAAQFVDIMGILQKPR